MHNVHLRLLKYHLFQNLVLKQISFLFNFEPIASQVSSLERAQAQHEKITHAHLSSRRLLL